MSWKSVQCETSCSRLTERHAESRTDRQTDRQADMTKPIVVAFCNFAHAPNDLTHSFDYYSTRAEFANFIQLKWHRVSFTFSTSCDTTLFHVGNPTRLAWGPVTSSFRRWIFPSHLDTSNPLQSKQHYSNMNSHSNRSRPQPLVLDMTACIMQTQALFNKPATQLIL
jgi:hypothetical protein